MRNAAAASHAVVNVVKLETGPDEGSITQTFPCKIQRYFTAIKRFFQMKNCAQNIDCVYTLEPPQFKRLPTIYVLDQK